jgi:hypothetical protein
MPEKLKTEAETQRVNEYRPIAGTVTGQAPVLSKALLPETDQGVVIPRMGFHVVQAGTGEVEE